MNIAAVDIQNYLPHRAPLLMVDLILDIDANFVETIFFIQEDNIFVDKNIFLFCVNLFIYV